MKKLLGIVFILVLTTGSSSAQAPGGNIQVVRPDRIRVPERSLLQREKLRLKLTPRNEEAKRVEEKRKMRKTKWKARRRNR